VNLIQVLLPLSTDRKENSKRFRLVRHELASRFGGLTLYGNAPAEGLWEDEGAVETDAIVIVEVMAEELDLDWWAAYRVKLERRFHQDEIVIRSMTATRL